MIANSLSTTWNTFTILLVTAILRIRRYQQSSLSLNTTTSTGKNISFAYNWWMMYKDFSTSAQKALYSTNLLHEISSRFNNFVSPNNTQTPTFFSYMGHYSTLAAILALFNITTPECLKIVFLGGQSLNPTCYGPKFASSLRFELYRRTDASDSYLKMFYDDSQINVCANNTTPCTVEMFKRTVELLTNGWDLTDYFQECYYNLVPRIDEGRGLKITLWIILAVNLLLTLCLIFVLNRTKREKKSKLRQDAPLNTPNSYII